MKSATNNLAIQVTIILAFERKTAVQQRKKQNTHGPDIRTESRVLLASHYLRRHVAWSAAEDFELLARGNDSRESEVDDLHRSRFIEQKILQLDVSVYNVSVVKVLDAMCHLEDDAVQQSPPIVCQAASSETGGAIHRRRSP